MNNTQHQERDNTLMAPAAAPYGEDQNQIVTSERRPKPIRGVGYGNIFAAGAAKPKQLQQANVAAAPATDLVVGNASNSLASNNDRINSTIVNALQKQIPKKPPPPSPETNNLSNSSNGQAPALPPKPAYKFSPHNLQHMKPLPPIQQHPAHQSSSALMQTTRREQARVLYAYMPTNDDELALNVGDVIDIIDKNCEDAGWWKGELRGKVGVFPDNFVQVIKPLDTTNNNTTTSATSTPTSVGASGNIVAAAVAASNNIAPSTPMTQSTMSQQNFTPPNNALAGQDWHHNRMSNVGQQQTSAASNFTNSTTEVNKLKSVFSMTPKGFSKELEDNLEKRNSPASFLSLKRNKLQQQMAGADQSTSDIAMNENEKKDDVVSSSAENSRENSSSNITNTTGTTKLNHITVNRAKGPARKPPSSVLNKRTSPESIKTETNGRDVTQDTNTVEQISQDFNSEIQELKEEVRQLREELVSFAETKQALDLMKIELKACQSATETQAKYIRELVSSLVDERKKLAVMQMDMDQRLR